LGKKKRAIKHRNTPRAGKPEIGANRIAVTTGGCNWGAREQNCTKKAERKKKGKSSPVCRAETDEEGHGNLAGWECNWGGAGTERGRGLVHLSEEGKVGMAVMSERGNPTDRG